MNDPDINKQEKKKSNLEIWLKDIQDRIIEEEKSMFSKKVIELFNAPLNIGTLEDADVHATIKGWCGDTMEMFLKIEDDRIVDIMFNTDGCGATIAVGSMMTSLVKGMYIEDAWKINEQDLLDALGGLPEENLHCATLSVNTLRKALDEILKKTVQVEMGEQLENEEIQVPHQK